MKARILATLSVALIAVVAFAAPAYAWAGDTTAVGTYLCTEGKGTITWTLSNSSTVDAIVLTSSDTAVLPIGSTVPKTGSASFPQDVSPGTYSLTGTVNYPGPGGDVNPYSFAAAPVTVETACTSPSPTVTPTVTPTPTPTVTPSVTPTVTPTVKPSAKPTHTTPPAAVLPHTGASANLLVAGLLLLIAGTALVMYRRRGTH